MKKKLILFVAMCLVVAGTSSAFAAVSLKRLGVNPFSPPMTSEADLRAMVGNNSADLQAGFAKAGNPELFTEFMAQFPTAAIDSIRIAPGERLDWMLFRKGKGAVKVIKDVTWDGEAAFDAYRFSIDKDGQRYEFVVPVACGNLSLRNVGMVPEKPAVAPPPVAAVPEPVPEPKPVAERKGGPVVDVGYAHMADPANYVFARVGYEIPLAEKLYAMGLVGGFVRFDGNDGSDAFTADALLNYYFTEKMFIGAGAGFWSGDDGKLDLILNAGYQVYENPGAMKMLLFLEARTYADDFGERDTTRLGAGLRFRF